MDVQRDDGPQIGASAPNGARRNVMVIGRDQPLLESRALVMERGGFGALITTDLEEAHRTIAEGKADFLMLCHSLPELEARTIVGRAELQRPTMPVLLLTWVAPSFPLAIEHFDVTTGPKALIAKCSQMFAFAARR